MRFKEYLLEHTLKSFPYLALEKGPSYAILKVIGTRSDYPILLTHIGQTLCLHGYEVETPDGRDLKDVKSGDGQTEIHIYPHDSMSDMYDGDDEELKGKFEKIKSKELDEFLKTIELNIEDAFKMDEDVQAPQESEPAGMWVAKGPLEDGLYSVAIKPGYEYSNRGKIMRLAMTWLVDRGYSILDREKNDVTEATYDEKPTFYYVKPKSMFNDMFDGDDDQMKELLKNAHTRVKPTQVFSDIEECLDEAYISVVHPYMNDDAGMYEAENPLNDPSEEPAKFDLNDFTVRKVEPGLFEIEYRSKYNIGQNLFDRFENVLASNGLGIIKTNHPHRMFKYNVWTMQVHDTIDSMHDGEKMVSDESIEKRVKKSIQDLGKLHERTVKMIKHILDTRGVDGIHNWLEDGGDDLQESVEFPVKQSDFELTGPDEHGMWKLSVKDAEIRRYSDTEKWEWHMRVVKNLIRLIIWTDEDDNISVFSPPMSDKLAPDSFKITKGHHIPDYPLTIYFRPTTIFPDMIDGDAKTKLLKRIATSKASFVNKKLNDLLKIAINNTKSDFEHWNNPLDDVEF